MFAEEEQKSDIYIAFYAVEKRASRIPAVRSSVPKHGLVVLTRPDPVDALAYAIHNRREGRKVCLIGTMEDVHAPDDLCTNSSPAIRHELDRIWRESLISAADCEGVGYIPLAEGDSEYLPHMETRWFHKFTTSLLRMLHERISSSVFMAPASSHFGRPPFGYRVIDGNLVLYRAESEIVAEVFKLAREKKIGREIIEEIRKRWPDLNIEYSKIRRILEKAELYCLGKNRGRVCKDLACLPPEWVGTTLATLKSLAPEEEGEADAG